MIIFRRLTFQNFLSAGNRPVEIQLDTEKTTLIHGTNGSGKSTILDALCYSLFNKPFRKVNLPQLINTQNKKGLVVSVDFTIGSNEFRVVRGQKPKVFEIYKNGEPIDQKAADKDNQAFLEQNILKLTYKSFTQIVILGSSNFVPFMQLPAAGRRECIEDFLDIKVFSTMSVIAKERLRGLKDRLRETKGDIGNLEYKIDVQEQRIKELESSAAADTKQLESKIQECEHVIVKAEADIAEYQGAADSYQTQVDDLLKKDPAKKSKQFQSVIGKLGNKIERLQKNIAFYQENDHCHSCNQVIAEDVKTDYITGADKEVAEYTKAVEDAKGLMAEHEQTIAQAADFQSLIQEVQSSIFKKQTIIDSRQREITDCQNKLTELQMSSGSIDKEQARLSVLQEDLQGLRSKALALVTETDEHEVVVSLLKDSGIKTQIVKKYLPVMNKFIRKYLTELDLPLHFVLDEQFNESVSSPLHQDFSYASFSEGQKGRIDIALMLTWRELCKLKNSVTCNLLILDEVFSGSLDEVGKEYLLHILRFQLENTNVIVVDHTLSGNFKDKFDRQIEVTRVTGFSKYE
jgi:DNA repair exonuclease SbcCD ATPase subunit